MKPYTHVWWWHPAFPGCADRKGLLCRVLVRGRMNSVAVELETGERVVTSRYAIRRLVALTPRLQMALAISWGKAA